MQRSYSCSDILAEVKINSYEETRSQLEHFYDLLRYSWFIDLNHRKLNEDLLFLLWRSAMLYRASDIINDCWGVIRDIDDYVYSKTRENSFTSWSYIDDEDKILILEVCCTRNSSLIEQTSLHLQQSYDPFEDERGYSTLERAIMDSKALD